MRDKHLKLQPISKTVILCEKPPPLPPMSTLWRFGSREAFSDTKQYMMPCRPEDNAEQNYCHHRGADPTEDHRGADPTEDHRGVDPTEDHRGADPTEDHRGADPTEDHRGADPTEDHRGADPTEDHRGADPTEDHRGADPTEDHRGADPTEDHRGADPTEDHRGADPTEDHAPDTKGVFYSTRADETCDTSNKEQLSFVLKSEKQ